MTARIYRPARNAMQSGKGKSKQWVLVHEQAIARKIEPLMGYTSSSDMSQQIKLSFPTLEEAEGSGGASHAFCGAHMIVSTQNGPTHFTSQ